MDLAPFIQNYIISHYHSLNPIPLCNLYKNFLTLSNYLHSLHLNLNHQPNHFHIERFNKLSTRSSLPQSPGPDGFINGNYKAYTDELVPHLCYTSLSTQHTQGLCRPQCSWPRYVLQSNNIGSNQKLWDSAQPWTLIKANTFVQTPAPLLVAIGLDYHPSHSFLSIVNVTLSTWSSVLQSARRIHVEDLYQLPLSALSLLLPDLLLQNWSLQGLRKIGDLFQHNQLLSFLQIKDRFAISNKDFYKYLRLRHILTTISTPHNTWSKNNLQFLSSTNNKACDISCLYSLLTKSNMEEQTPAIQY